MLSIWDSKVKRACALIYGRRICQLTKWKYFSPNFGCHVWNFQTCDRWRKMADTMKDFCDYFAEKLSWQNRVAFKRAIISKLLFFCCRFFSKSFNIFFKSPSLIYSSFVKKYYQSIY
jgi:hypothetical protein